MPRWPLLLSLLAASALLSLAGTARAQGVGCRQVQGRSSSWIWCEGALTRMPAADRARLAMAQPPSPGAEEAGAPADPPRNDPAGNPADPQFSWHDLGGSDWMTGVRDQGSCGACFVFGSLGVVESMYKYLAGDPMLDVDLAEQEVVSCIALGSCESGGTAQEVGVHLQSDGVPDEACYPYTQTSGDCNARCADWQPRSSTITAWNMSTIPWTVDAIKAQLVHAPLAANMHVYSDFYGYTDGVYSRAGDATPVGWHVVAVVGWDDADDSWICKNSWGRSFGQEGYFKISRAADCMVLVTGTCFASNVTTFEVELPNLPGLACLDQHQIAIDAEQPAQSTATVQVRNCGANKDITLSADASPAAPWLSWKAAADLLAPGAETTLSLTGDSTLVEPGTHVTTLSVYGGSGISTVAITFNVTAPPVPPPDGGGGAGGGGAPPPSAAQQQGPTDEGGCGCRLHTAASGLAASGLGLGLGMLALGRRRRRHG
jgi:hypothetical protein